jgi:hypothetical protein
MPTITGIDPMTVRLADLDVMEAKPQSSIEVIQFATAQRPLFTKRDAKQQLLGAMRIINHLSGSDMRQKIDTVEFLSLRVDELEALLAEERKAFEDEKVRYQRAMAGEIAGYKKALRNIAAVIEPYRNPFDALPFSKWKNEAKGQWMLAAAESIQWAVQRAENQIDPVNAVPIAPDDVS